jgi:hypothetical protein
VTHLAGTASLHTQSRAKEHLATLFALARRKVFHLSTPERLQRISAMATDPPAAFEIASKEQCDALVNKASVASLHVQLAGSIGRAAELKQFKLSCPAAPRPKQEEGCKGNLPQQPMGDPAVW